MSGPPTWPMVLFRTPSISTCGDLVTPWIRDRVHQPSFPTAPCYVPACQPSGIFAVSFSA